MEAREVCGGRQGRVDYWGRCLCVSAAGGTSRPCAATGRAMTSPHNDQQESPAESSVRADATELNCIV